MSDKEIELKPNYEDFGIPKKEADALDWLLHHFSEYTDDASRIKAFMVANPGVVYKNMEKAYLEASTQHAQNEVIKMYKSRKY